MKKKKVSSLIIILILIVGILVITFSKKEVNEVIKSNRQNINNVSALSIMLETDTGSGSYEKSSNSTWPTGDYVFNETLSKCENGGTLTFNDINQKVILKTNISDKCYAYFDIKPKVLFANYIKGLYTTNGENNLYLHNSSLANSANDNSIRYAGSSETTNNFVCFGSDSTICESDNLYRIIGVFGDQVKLIKYDYANSNMLGTSGDYTSSIYSKSDYSDYKGSLTAINRYYFNYALNSKVINNWETSLLNKINLNTYYINYLNSQDAKWVNMIVDINWNIGRNTPDAAISKAFYNLEIKQQTTELSKIGLMQVSDYGYATIPSNWSTNLTSYSSPTIIKDNWMNMGLDEWTIIAPSTNSNYMFILFNSGAIGHSTAEYGKAVRPVFYLKADTLYINGEGTQSNPYRIA